MMEFAVNLNKPIVIRYPRGGEGSYKFSKHEKIEEGKAEVLKDGNDVTILGIGKMTERAMLVAEKLKEKSIDAGVINVRFLKPLDKQCIKKAIEKTKKVVTIEDGTIINGLATAIKELIVEENLQNITVQNYAYPDEFIKHGSVEEIEEIYGINVQKIVDDIQELDKINV